MTIEGNNIIINNNWETLFSSFRCCVKCSQDLYNNKRYSIVCKSSSSFFFSRFFWGGWGAHDSKIMHSYISMES